MVSEHAANCEKCMMQIQIKMRMRIKIIQRSQNQNRVILIPKEHDFSVLSVQLCMVTHFCLKVRERSEGGALNIGLFHHQTRKNHISFSPECLLQHLSCSFLGFLLNRGQVLEKVLWDFESIQLKDFQLTSKNNIDRHASHCPLSICDDLEVIAAFVLSCYIYYQSGLRGIQFKLDKPVVIFSVDFLRTISKPSPKKFHFFDYSFLPKQSSDFFDHFENANPSKFQKEAIVDSQPSMTKVSRQFAVQIRQISIFYVYFGLFRLLLPLYYFIQIHQQGFIFFRCDYYYKTYFQLRMKEISHILRFQHGKCLFLEYFERKYLSLKIIEGNVFLIIAISPTSFLGTLKSSSADFTISTYVSGLEKRKKK